MQVWLRRRPPLHVTGRNALSHAALQSAFLPCSRCARRQWLRYGERSFVSAEISTFEMFGRRKPASYRDSPLKMALNFLYLAKLWKELLFSSKVYTTSCFIFFAFSLALRQSADIDSHSHEHQRTSPRIPARYLLDVGIEQNNLQDQLTPKSRGRACRFQRFGCETHSSWKTDARPAFC